MNKVQQTNMRNEKGFTLVELMVVLVIIAILAGVAISNFSATKVRAYDANAQTSLHYIFKACKDYWTFNSSTNACLVSTISTPEYGYILPSDIEIVIDSDGNNTEFDFFATAIHTSSANAFVIDFSGAVSIITLDIQGGGNDNSPEEVKRKAKGKKNRGCSEVAKKHLKKIGKKAKGGCKQL
jgi:type IV pilus assembly protein PilA